jgi:hypothetical protein
MTARYFRAVVLKLSSRPGVWQNSALKFKVWCASKGGVSKEERLVWPYQKSVRSQIEHFATTPFYETSRPPERGPLDIIETLRDHKNLNPAKWTSMDQQTR